MGLGRGTDAAARSSAATSPRCPSLCRATCPSTPTGVSARHCDAPPNRLAADALLLHRACGLRIGELLDLELDCVHEIPGNGAWLKVPLGKLDTERMVPLDEETVTLIDRIVATARRSAARRTRGPAPRPVPLHPPRPTAGPERPLRPELNRAAKPPASATSPRHQLRHTFATAMVNAGVSLQASWPCSVTSRRR